MKNFKDTITLRYNKETGQLSVKYLDFITKETKYIYDGNKINEFLEVNDLMEKYDNFCKEVAKRVA